MVSEDINSELDALAITYTNKIKLWCKENDMTVRQLCNISGVEYNTVWFCFSNNRIPSSRVVYAFYKKTNIKLI